MIHRPMLILGLCALGGCSQVLGLDGFEPPDGESTAAGGHGGTGGADDTGGRAGVGGRRTSCAGVPVLQTWDFSGSDPLANLEPRANTPGGVENGVLLFDYQGEGTGGEAGREYVLPNGSTRVSACFRARWNRRFLDDTMVLGHTDFYWPVADVACSVFAAITSDGRFQLYVFRGSGDNTNLMGNLATDGISHEVELFVDWTAGVARASLDGDVLMTSTDTLDGCGGGEPAAGTVVLGGTSSFTSADVRLSVDDLAIGAVMD